MTDIREGAPTASANTATRLAPRGLVLGLSVLGGLAVAILWSARLVDDDIGVNTANGILGAHGTTATTTVAGLVVAFVTGLAGTFTACNVAVFSAIAPMVESRPTAAGRLRQALRPLGWLTLGAVVVAGGYGAIGAVIGDRIPQLSGAVVDGDIPVRTLQSITVFGVIGIVLLYLGLAELRLVPDVLGSLAARYPAARQLVMGALIGGFLIGRPWPLFRQMFANAASTHNALYGAAAFVLVVVGNMVVMSVLFLILSFSRFPAWLRRTESRVATVTAAALLVGGTFTFAYWALRVPANLGIGWFPPAPWH
ncbi:MAG TPA: hypothetical protein VGG05_20235 [Pseudonocardiaceae bacterium]